MSAAVTCTSCNRPLHVPEAVLGCTVRCPLCQDEFVAQPDPAAAGLLIEALRTPTVATVMRKQGLEPIGGAR